MITFLIAIKQHNGLVHIPEVPLVALLCGINSNIGLSKSVQ